MDSVDKGVEIAQNSCCGSPRMRDPAMTKLLEKALAKVCKLPAAEQNTIASMILDELSDEQQWHAAFARSQDQLKSLAEKVRRDISRSRCMRSVWHGDGERSD